MDFEAIFSNFVFWASRRPLTCDSSSALLAFALCGDCSAGAAAAAAVTGGGGTAVLAMNESRSFSWYTAARPGRPESEMGRRGCYENCSPIVNRNLPTFSFNFTKTFLRPQLSEFSSDFPLTAVARPPRGDALERLDVADLRLQRPQLGLQRLLCNDIPLHSIPIYSI